MALYKLKFCISSNLQINGVTEYLSLEVSKVVLVLRISSKVKMIEAFLVEYRELLMYSSEVCSFTSLFVYGGEESRKIAKKLNQHFLHFFYIFRSKIFNLVNRLSSL